MTPANNADYTAKQYKKHNPKMYAAVVLMRCVERVPVLLISKALKISQATIAAIERAEMYSKDADELRAHAAVEWRQMSDMARQRAMTKLLDENDNSMRLVELAQTAVMAEEKAELLTGGATQRVAQVTLSISPEDYEARIKRLLEQKKEAAVLPAAPEALPEPTAVVEAQASPKTLESPAQLEQANELVPSTP